MVVAIQKLRFVWCQIVQKSKYVDVLGVKVLNEVDEKARKNLVGLDWNLREYQYHLMISYVQINIKIS